MDVELSTGSSTTESKKQASNGCCAAGFWFTLALIKGDESEQCNKIHLSYHPTSSVGNVTESTGCHVRETICESSLCLDKLKWQHKLGILRIVLCLVWFAFALLQNFLSLNS
jgi:hypothetical protein